MSDDAGTIHMFWHGGELFPLAHACIQSFVSHGHPVRVHAYDSLALPPGAVLEDAREVIAADDPLQRLLVSTIQGFADCFRYALLHQRGGWWVDTDVYCLTSHLPNEGRAWAEQEPGRINNAILRFAKGDPLCERLAWFARRRARPSMHWGAIGPDLATEVLSAHHDKSNFGSRETFYPLHWREAHFLWLPELKPGVVQRLNGAAFLHCWAEVLKKMGIHPRRAAPAGSFLAEILRHTPDVMPLTRWQRIRARRKIDRFVRQTCGGDLCVTRLSPQCNVLARRSDGRLFAPRETWAAIRTRISGLLGSRWPAFRQLVNFQLRAIMCGAQLPPGSLRPLQGEIDSDQQFFIKRADALGPIFKATLNGAYTTCVVGHRRGMRLVAENEDRIPGFTLDLRRLFPIGALREMTGETHQWYRRLLIQAVQATPASVYREASERIIRDGLGALAQASSPLAGDKLRDQLRRMTTRIMFRVLFGVREGFPEFSELETNYRRFGPSAPVYCIHDEHARAFVEITAALRRIAQEMPRDTSGNSECFLRHLDESGTLDETLLGNLAYLFEPSHFDLYSLWHWVLFLLATHPEVPSAFASQPDATARRLYAEAIVLETLRMEQSELLYRRVIGDIVFDGFLLPAGTNLRVCLWEGHKDAAAFPDPFMFDPSRFVGRTHGRETFAPFGFGQHHCVGANLVVGLSTIFVQLLLEQYRLEATGAGPAHRGAYHWQPSQTCVIRLISRLPPEAL
jgi:cytochrome P450